MITLCPTDKLAALDLILECEVRPVTVTHSPERFVHNLEVQYHCVHGCPLTDSPVLLRSCVKTIDQKKGSYGQKNYSHTAE